MEPGAFLSGFLADLGCTYAAALDNAGEFPGGPGPSDFSVFGGAQTPLLPRYMEDEGRWAL